MLLCTNECDFPSNLVYKYNPNILYANLKKLVFSWISCNLLVWCLKDTN